MNKLIIDALTPIGVPVAYQDYTGGESSYIRFLHLPQVDSSTDDDEQYTTRYVQVDYFTPGNPSNVAREILSRMKSAGFKKNFEHETYEQDTKVYHHISRFYIIEEAI